MDNILIALVFIVLLGAIAHIVEVVVSKQCKHEWEIDKEGTLNYSNGPEFGFPYGNWYLLKCKHCGKLKQNKFK